MNQINNIANYSVKNLQHYRMLSLGGAVIYAFWWFVIEALLKGSYNPVLSRILVVGYFLSIFAISYFSLFVQKYIDALFEIGAWGTTLHYFYLFYNNQTDINWVVGCYVTIIATCAVFQTVKGLLSYCGFALVLSVGLSLIDKALLKTIFLPGAITIVSLAYLGLKARLSLIKELNESFEHLQSILDSTYEGIVIHANGKIFNLNESMAKIFGYERRELIGKNLLDLSVLEYKPEVVKQISLESGHPSEILGLKKDGSIIPIELRGKKHLHKGVYIGLTTVQDLTERKEYERKKILLASTQKALAIRDEFISIASHELKTPLTSLKLQTQIAQKKINHGSFNIEGLKYLVNVTDKQVNKLITLVEDMLDISKISQGKLDISKEYFDLSKAFVETLESFSESFLLSGNTILANIAGNIFIYGDEFRIQQILINLLTNAMKYGANKPIHISLEDLGTTVQFMVEDNGIGISEEDQLRVFERFERVISFKNISGFGLGLYISKKIVDAHQGTIKIESRLGDGARFIVTLPKNKSTI